MTLIKRKELARKSRDPETLDRLSRDEHWAIRWEVADNPNTPTGILNRLSWDRNDRVRWIVAGSPNTLVETLDRLSRDEDEAVRRRVAKNPKWQQLQELGLLDVARRASKWLEIL